MNRRVVVSGITAILALVIVALATLSAGAAPSGVTYPGNPVVVLDANGTPVTFGGGAQPGTPAANATAILVAFQDTNGNVSIPKNDPNGYQIIDPLAQQAATDNLNALPGTLYYSVPTFVPTGTSNTQSVSIPYSGPQSNTTGLTSGPDIQCVSAQVSNGANQALNSVQLTFSDTVNGQTATNSIGTVTYGTPLPASTPAPQLTEWEVPPGRALKTANLIYTWGGNTTAGNVGTLVVLSQRPCSAPQSLTGRLPVTISDGTNTGPTGDAPSRPINIVPVYNGGGVTNGGVKSAGNFSAGLTPIAIKGSTGILYALVINNPSGATVWAQVYDAPAATAVVAGNNADWQASCAANSTCQVILPNQGIPMSNGFSVGCSTNNSGTATPCPTPGRFEWVRA